MISDALFLHLYFLGKVRILNIFERKKGMPSRQIANLLRVFQTRTVSSRPTEEIPFEDDQGDKGTER